MALRLADVMPGLHEGRLAAEIGFNAPLQQIKVLTRGKNLQLVGISAGYKAAWPKMMDFLRQDMRPLLMNEAHHYAEGSDYLKEADRGDVLMLSGVSNRLLAIGDDVPESLRFRWHTIIRRIDGELIHEMIFEHCGDGTRTGFERVLRRDDISSMHE
jgi:hypothetical protein